MKINIIKRKENRVYQLTELGNARGIFLQAQMALELNITMTQFSDIA